MVSIICVKLFLFSSNTSLYNREIFSLLENSKLSSKFKTSLSFLNSPAKNLLAVSLETVIKSQVNKW